jgi:bacillolysin
MTRLNPRGLAAVAVVLSLNLAISAQPVGGQRFIQSLTEPDEGLTVRHSSPQTGRPTFAAARGKGLLLNVKPGAPAHERAMAFVAGYGRAFGVDGPEHVRVTRTATDEIGHEHVRMQQLHKNVPVTGGELLVHMKGPRVLAANGRTADGLPDNVLHGLPTAIARNTARQLVTKRGLDPNHEAEYSEPRLEILNRAFLAGEGTDLSRLAWFVEARATGLRQFIWIDAQSGAVLLNFSQLPHAKNRVVFNAGNTPALPGTQVRAEGGAATGDADSDNAYLFAGVTYDYFLSNFGRDSYDGAGAQLRSTTHYCPASICPGNYENAFWNGSQMVYGNGFASADDVVGHELAHAVTEYTANLFYYQQSGALNESFSDIFGEAIDLSSSAGSGNDTAGVRWRLGEDLNGGIRDMMNPNLFGDPAKITDPFFYCTKQAWNDPNADSGGVHWNSGVPNHAFALMVDGGTFNEFTITGIGLAKAAKIQYRALTTYLVSGSNFIDAYDAVNQSCTDLIGTAGITSANCTQVNNALDAVEMSLPLACAGATQAPPLCSSGEPSFVFNDDFESGIGSWSRSAPFQVGQYWQGWFHDQGITKSGIHAAYGTNSSVTATHVLEMNTGVVVPAGGRMYFDHLFEFENDLAANYDGGRLEYSLGEGPWIDAGSLIHAGHLYNGNLESTNPLGSGMAFVGASYGYVGSRLNLAAFAGQSIRFRFRLGSDNIIGSLGWLLDNVGIYSCVGPPPPLAFTDDPLVAGVTRIKVVHVTELRNRINAIRAARGLGAASWTNDITTGTVVRSGEVLEMRTALAGAYTATSLPVPSFTDTLLTPTAVKTTHITQLRAAVVAME